MAYPTSTNPYQMASTMGQPTMSTQPYNPTQPVMRTQGGLQDVINQAQNYRGQENLLSQTQPVPDYASHGPGGWDYRGSIGGPLIPGGPGAPIPRSLIDPNTGQLVGPLRQDQADTFERLALGRQGIEEGAQRDVAARTAATANRAAIRDLSSMGGIQSGARERLAGQAREGSAIGMQNVFRQGMLDRSGLALDAQNIRGAENQFNITAAIEEQRRQDDLAQRRWEEQMKAISAQRTGEAQVRAADEGNSSHVCTRLAKDGFGWNKKQKLVLRDLSRWALQEHKTTAQFYFKYFGKVAGDMNAQDLASARKKIMQVIQLWLEGKKTQAFYLYKQMSIGLLKNHFGEV